MTRALFDSDTFIALIRGAKDIRDRVQSYPGQSFAVSTITIFELRFGADKSREPAKNHKFLTDTLSPFSILEFNESASIQAAKVRAHLEKIGQGIGPYDTLIAGHALALNIELISANTREFSRVPNLKLSNWINPPQAKHPEKHL